MVSSEIISEMTVHEAKEILKKLYTLEINEGIIPKMEESIRLAELGVTHSIVSPKHAIDELFRYDGYGTQIIGVKTHVDR